LRPAVVLADAGRGDFIPCQVTSRPYGDPRAVKIDDASLAAGSLRVTSFARPGKLFTANNDLIEGEIATLHVAELKDIVEAVSELLRAAR
jgi:mRNA interferase MazF